jgi:glutamine synthetase
MTNDTTCGGRHSIPSKSGHIVSPQRADEVERWLDAHDVHRVFVGWPDLHGLMRGKYLSRDRFVATLGSGVPMSSAPLYMDLRGETEDSNWPAGLAGWPNFVASPDLESLRPRAYECQTAEVMADLYNAQGELLPEAPRTVLRRVLELARERGIEFKVGVELEFFLFAKDDTAVLPPGPQALRAQLGKQEATLLRRLWECLESMGLPPEAACVETGPAQLEVNVAGGPPLAACDQATSFKRTVKQMADEAGFVATFMAKPIADASGNGFHLHQTATRVEGGSPLWFREGKALAKTCREFVAGQLAYAPELAAIYLPTVNSYKRTRLRGPAPLQLCWGWDNRSAAIRLLEAQDGSARVENRIGGGDANPYLLVAAALATGMEGVLGGLTLEEPVVGNAYLDGAPRPYALPPDLERALTALAQSNLAHSWFGTSFVEVFVRIKSREVDRFASAVTDWEREEYVTFL